MAYRRGKHGDIKRKRRLAFVDFVASKYAQIPLHIRGNDYKSGILR
jgi:hypothetical protein